MIKSVLIAVSFFVFCSINGQVLSGTVVESGRKLIGKFDFEIVGNKSGVVVVECAVNRKGDVTATKVVYDETTITSTPDIMKSQNRGKKLKFTAGNGYAAFEHVRVKYVYKKEK